MGRIEVIKKRFDDYMVHFDFEMSHWLTFNVYYVTDLIDANTGEKSLAYNSKEDPMEFFEIFDKEKCRTMFSGSYCYRGVWESRLYFSEDEYWGEDLITMANLFKDHIEPVCKKYLKKMDPNIKEVP
jgi:hypothetical protein